MLSAYKYRIYPNPEQEMRLKRSLLILCSLYNELRAKKMQAYKENGVSFTRTDLRATALQERRYNPELQSIYSQVVQNVADRVAVAFSNFFEGRARFPKIKQSKKYLSFTYPQSGFKITPQKRLHLSRIGSVRIFLHRPILGRIERLTVKHEADEWYAIFITEHETPPKLPIEAVRKERIRGGDLGLEKFITLDNAESVKYSGFLRKSEDKIRVLQKRLAHKRRGSKRWRQACFSIAKLHLRVKRQREDFQKKLVNAILTENDALVMENLNISGMVRNHVFAKSISDASFAEFVRRAIFKAEMLGKHFIAVDPWGTTQFCNSCLAWVPKDLTERNHMCPNCRVRIPLDLNSARLIKRLGILRCLPSDGGLSLAESKSLPSLSGMVSQGAEAGSHRF